MGRAPGPLGVVHPRDWVQISEAASYVVPVGKIFVLTGLGASEAYGTWVGFWEGTRLVILASPEHSADTTSITSVPVGISAAAGATLSVNDDHGGSGNALAVGYLVDA